MIKIPCAVSPENHGFHDSDGECPYCEPKRPRAKTYSFSEVEVSIGGVKVEGFSEDLSIWPTPEHDDRPDVYRPQLLNGAWSNGVEVDVRRAIYDSGPRPWTQSREFQKLMNFGLPRGMSPTGRKAPKPFFEPKLAFVDYEAVELRTFAEMCRKTLELTYPNALAETGRLKEWARPSSPEDLLADLLAVDELCRKQLNEPFHRHVVHDEVVTYKPWEPPKGIFGSKLYYMHVDDPHSIHDVLERAAEADEKRLESFLGEPLPAETPDPPAPPVLISNDIAARARRWCDED